MAATSTQQIALITGIAGFIGAFLGKRLLEEGWTVIGYDNLNDYYDVSLKRERLDMLQEASGNSGRFVFTHADLCDAEALEGVFRQWRIDVVVNLAAQISICWRWPDLNVAAFRGPVCHRPVIPGRQESKSALRLPNSSNSSNVTGRGPTTLIPFVKTKKHG